MFGRFHAATAPYLNPRAGEDPHFWDDLDNRRREYRNAAFKLGVIMLVFAVLGLLVHNGFFIFTLALLPFALLQLWMVRRTRSTARIPDFRNTDATNGPQPGGDTG